MICGSLVDLSSFKDIRTISQNQYTTISIATDSTNPTNRYFFKTFNCNCTSGHQQKIFVNVFSDISISTLSSTSIPANSYAISQNQSVFSFFNATHYYESYSSLDFSNRFRPTFCSLCISEITLDKILRRQVQISNSWSLEDSLNCLFSVAISMKRLHDSLLIHGNLCPSNILVDKVKQCYISDFGLYRIKEIYYKPPFVNPQYSAPEIDPLHPTRATDIFSYGVIMCRLLQEYFLQGNKYSLVQLIMEGCFDFRTLPAFLSEIISQCLEKNPSKRCNFDFIIQTFQAKSFVIKHINISDNFYKFTHKFYIEKLANANDPTSLNILGDLLANPSKAFEIKDRNSESMQNIKKRPSDRDRSSKSYLKYDKKIDEQMSAECYKRSASFGNSEAQANYGVCLLSGNGIPIDMLNGLSNIENSAKQGCIKGLYAYGICNMKGIGVNKIDFVTAEKYLRAAADASGTNVNNVNNSIICKARYNLGLIMEKQNKQLEAAKCFKSAAYMALESKTNSWSPTSFACPEALYAYGRYLKKGIGISTDLSAACHFFKMSHFQGYKPGSFEYAKMVLEKEIYPNIGMSDEDSYKFEKNEAELIMKSLSEVKYSKAEDYLSKSKLSQNITRESSKDRDKSREKSRDSEMKKEKERSKESEKDRNKEKEKSKDKERIKDKETESKQKKVISNEKLKEKYKKLQNDLIENKSNHLFKYEDELVELKDADIINDFANYYNQGEYVTKDIDKACYYYKLSADLGNSDAQVSYGNLLIEGKVGPDYKKDFEGAMRMFQKSAMQGNRNGMNCFSVALIDEKNTDPKVVRYLHVLKEMADKGPNLAKLFYGKLLLKGPKYDYDRNKEGFHKNPEEGIKYIKMAVEAKVPQAYYNYASCMLKGNGLPKNEKKAMQIIEDIANKENDKAAILKCYRYYRDSEPRKALTFMKKAADLGDVEQMYKYGEKLVYGDFSESDVKEGEYYMIKSGKEIPRDVQFKYFKKVNGKYVEIPEKDLDYARKKLEEVFSDDYEMVEPPKKDEQSKEDENDIQEIDNEPKAIINNPDIKSEPIIKKPLTPEELRSIDKKLIISYLRDRKANGMAKVDDEVGFVTDAINGDTEAMNYLGAACLEDSHFLKYGTQFYKFSCDRGNPKGMEHYAQNLKDGIGVRQNKKNAYLLYEKLADSYPNPENCYMFGYMNDNHIGCQKSKYKAFQYYLKAADEGHIKAMLNVADCYDKGIGNHLIKNSKMMVKYLKMVIQANNSNVRANYKLGEYYLESEKNPKKALKYLREAAASKHPRSNFLLYKLYSKFDYGPKFVTEQEALNCLSIACKANDPDAIRESKILSGTLDPDTDNPKSNIQLNNDDDDDDDEDYEVIKKSKKKAKKEVVQEIEEDQDYIEYYENDKDYIQQIIGIDPTEYNVLDIIKIGDEILSKANENYKKKQLEIEKESISKAAAVNATNIASEEYDAEKSKAERCFSYAMNKGEPLGYFKLGQIIDDPEQSLSYLEYAKDNGVIVAGDEYIKRLEQIGEFYKSNYIINKEKKNREEMKRCKDKMIFVASNYIKQQAYVSAAIWFRNADDKEDFNKYIDISIDKLDLLDGKQQFLLGQILETKKNPIATESAQNEQKKLVLEVYKRAVENGCKEAEPRFKNLSKKVLHELKSNADDSKSMNELGLTLLEGRNGAKIDQKEAANCFEKAASDGNVDGMVNYGKCFLFGTGVQKDDQKAFKYFKEAALASNEFRQMNSPTKNYFNEINTDLESSTTSSDDDDDTESPVLMASSSPARITIDNNKEHESLAEGICYYAFCLLKKRGLPQDEEVDTENIMKYFKLAAKMGNVEAMVQYGTHCIEQTDGPAFLKVAANSGNPEAQFYFSNYLKEKNPTLSSKYLKQAAENRSYSPFFPPDEDEIITVKKSAGYFEPAVEMWGKLLYENIDENADAAIHYFKKLSDDKNVYGLAMYAKCIYDGLIDDSEDEEASDSKYTRILKMAADLGDSGSQYKYAINKMEDEDEQNCSEEVSNYLKLAADQGNVNAMCSFAERLESGKGVTKNLDEAVKYCQMALSIEPLNDFAKDLLEQCQREMKENQ